LVVAVAVLVLLPPCGVSFAVPPLLYWLVAGLEPLRDLKWLGIIGRGSGSIYLWHTPVLLPGLTVVGAFCHLPSTVNFGLAIFTALGICLLLRLGLDQTWKCLFHRAVPKSVAL
jgi:peptidoglycan/LPS O-acetylase OafA/YrhL